jgi:hypothetical protein
VAAPASGKDDEPAPPDGGRRLRGRRLDLAVGIVLGIVIGIAVIVVFVFFGSEETIDAPSVDHSSPAAREAPQRPAPSGER